MKGKMKKIVALLCATVMVATTFFGHWYTRQAEAATDAEPVWLDGYEYLTIRDFDGLTPGTYEAGSGYKTYTASETTDFDNVLLSMKLTFAGGQYNTRFDFAGSAAWNGIQMYPNQNGDQLWFCAEVANSGINERYGPIITAAEAEVDRFIGKEFLLQLAFDFTAVDADKINLKLGVYINGNFIKDLTFEGLGKTYFGNCLSILSSADQKVPGNDITYDNVIPPIEPVFPDGYKNITIKDFEGLSAGTFEAGGGTKVYSAFNLTNFDNVLLSMKLKLTGTVGTWHTRVIIGGNATSAHDGFALCLAKDNGSELQLKNYNDSSLKNIVVTKTEAEVDGFLDNEFLLQLAFDFGEKDPETNKANLTVDIYVNGKLCKSGTIEGCDMTKMGNRLALYSQTDGGAITYDNVIAPIEPAKLDGFDNLTISDFTDNSGSTLTEGEYQASQTETFKNYSVSGLDNFDNKLLSMNVNFKGGTWANSIIIAGKDGWFGFDLHPSNDGSKLEFGTTRASSITSSSTPSLSATTAQIGSFLNNEFLLQIGFELGEETDGMVDLKLHVYIDGKLYNNEILTIENCTKSALASNVAVYLAKAQSGGKSIIIGKEVEFPTVPVEPVDPFEGYEEVTIKDFVDASGNVMEEKAYTRPGTSAVREAFTLANHPSFDEKVLSMNVKFKAGGYQTKLHVAGSNTYNGLWIYPNDNTGSQLWIIADTNYTGVSTKQDILINAAGIENFDSFVNTEFLLQLAFDFGEVDAETNKVDLLLDVYINGTLHGSKKIEGCDMAYFGNRMELYREAEESAIIVGSVGAEFPEDPGIQPSARYDKLTFGQFAIIDGQYSYKYQALAVSGTATDRTTLDKTVICGDIHYEGSDNSYIIWGGKNNWGWNGIRMYPKSDGTMKLTWHEGTGNITEIAILDSKTAGVAFVGEKYNIMLSSELVDMGGDANIKDIKIGIWFNGVLYNQQYFYATDMGNNYGNYFGVYCTDGDTVTLGSVPELLTQPSEDLEKVTYTQFGIEDGDYTGVKGALKGKDTVAGTVFCGDIKFTITDTTKYTYIYLGGTSNNLSGAINLVTNDPDKLDLTWGGSWIATLESSKAGVDFNGEEFNLMMSVELVDNNGTGVDDIKLGIWFNGFLYQNKYFIIADKGATLGNYLVIANEGATLTAIPELTKLPNENFDKVTISDFGYDNRVLEQADGAQYKTATNYTTLDKVVFSGDFRLSDSGGYYIMYGGKSPWDSMRLTIQSNGSAYFGWFNGNDSQAYTTVQAADVGLNSFTKETFNLKISTELVDNDGDGKVNDIKVGIWFNNIIYPINGNDYSIITDWGDLLGNYFSIYQETSGTNVLIRNDAEYQANPYYYEEISEFRKDSGYTYPTLEGYVFAGWYEDEAYTTWIETDVKSGDAWAKFVEEDVLSAKPQVKVDSGRELPLDSTSLRFVTTVDNLNYRKISFYLQKAGGNEVDAAQLSGENAKLVYEKLYYMGSNTEIMEYKPSVFSWQSEYFKAVTLNGIPYADYGIMIKATPFWVTMDGTEVRGKTLETCVNNYEKMGTNTSKAVSIDFIGEGVMPITGYFGPYKVSESADPLLIPDYNTDTYFKMIADAGVNVMVYNNVDYASNPDLVKKQLELGEKYGVGVYVMDKSIYNMSESDMIAQIANYSHYKSFSGMYLVDEPGTSSYCSEASNGVVDNYKNAAEILKKNNIPYYCNAFPVLDVESNWWEGLFGSSGINDSDKSQYLSYLSEYNQKLNPSVISYDYYPFSDTRKNDDGTYNLSLYFWNIDAIRDKAKETSKPFWAFVQAGSQWNDGEKYFNSTKPYYPTKGEFNWNANTALAFGAQGIQYFPLVQPKHFAYAGTSEADKMWDFNRNGLIGAAGNKTEWYDYAEMLNKHIAAIDNVLMNASSKQIIALGAKAQNDTNGLSDVTTTATYNNVLTGATGNALIGCFDYCGKTALYVVNYDYATAGQITLTFNESKNITKIQNAVTTAESGQSLTLDMAAGEGILLVIK